MREKDEEMSAEWPTWRRLEAFIEGMMTFRMQDVEIE
jgi:hypothetical protein